MNSNLLSKLQGNSMAIKISGHYLHAEYLRKGGTEWDKSYCNLCDENEIGTVMVDSNNMEIVKLREQLKSNLAKVNYQYTQFSIRNMINIHLLANDISTNYYFTIFRKKVFSLVKSTYMKRTNLRTRRGQLLAPAWNENNVWFNLIIIDWIILWSIAEFLDDIQISLL